MPPLALAPSHHQEISVRRPSKVFDVLEDLVVDIKPLANKQQYAVELRDLSRSSQIAIDEPALRQALRLRTEIGGKVEIVSTKHQMHTLAPFGADLLAGDRIEDNMTWNFIAVLTVAQEILESYGCVLLVISQMNVETPLGAGGTRIELWALILSHIIRCRGLGS